MYREKWRNYFFPRKHLPFKGKWQLLREVGKDILSLSAQLRLEWIIFYQTVGKENSKLTASHFGISRKTFHKWLKRFSEVNLRSLEEKSRAPINKRTWMVTKAEEERIVSLRKRYLKYGKKKLKVLYQAFFKEKISTWKIERVIRKHQLYFDKAFYLKNQAKRQKKRLKPKVLITNFNKKRELGFLWHVDCIILWWYGVKRVIFTALEDISKITFARVYSTNSSKNAKDFLERIIYLANGKIDNIHQDNGSEFAGLFEKACQELSILQIYSRVKTPQDNACLERFNWTVQDEWLSKSEVGLDDINRVNIDLANWLVEYNSIRPHENLDYLTPIQYAERNFNVLPMWSACTFS